MGIEFIGLDRVIQKLNGFEDTVNNPGVFQQKAATLMLADVNNSFASGGPGWPSLDPDTIKRKGNSQPLIRSGKYSKSFKPRFGKDFIDVFSTIWYGAQFHQRGEGGVPQRAVVLSQQAIQLIFDAFKLAFTFKAA
jgi:phage gpG-like protein